MSAAWRRSLTLSLFLVTVVGTGACAPRGRGALVIDRQGSFAVGGTVVTSLCVFDPNAQPAPEQPPSSAGQTLHGDHAYVFYRPEVILAEARPGGDTPGEESHAQRTPRDEADAEFLAQGKHLRLGATPPAGRVRADCSCRRVRSPAAP